MALEKAEIESALAQGLRLMNISGEDDVAAIEAKIRFHEQEAEKWRAKLPEK